MVVGHAGLEDQGTLSPIRLALRFQPQRKLDMRVSLRLLEGALMRLETSAFGSKFLNFLLFPSQFPITVGEVYVLALT